MGIQSQNQLLRTVLVGPEGKATNQYAARLEGNRQWAQKAASATLATCRLLNMAAAYSVTKATPLEGHTGGADDMIDQPI